MSTEVLEMLCNKVKLIRDQGVGELHRCLPSLNESERIQFEDNLIQLLGDSESSWESKQGSLLGAKALISFVNLENDREVEFIERMKEMALKFLTDFEVRVRIAAGRFTIQKTILFHNITIVLMFPLFESTFNITFRRSVWCAMSKSRFAHLPRKQRLRSATCTKQFGQGHCR